MIDSERFKLLYGPYVAPKVQKDTRQPLAQRSTLVESHIKSATRWLNSARDAGLFKKPGMIEQAKKDPDLAILADRAEFRQIIEPPQNGR
jgi:hypothetical protein